MENVSLAGQVAVVTGAGGLLGRRYALELAARGAAVVVNDIATNGDGQPVADLVCAEIRAAGGTAVACYDSVSTPAGGRAIVNVAVEQLGGVDVLINNAGAFRFARFGEMTEEQIEEVLQSHLGAAFYVTQPAWRYMAQNGYGRIVSMSSSNSFGMQGSANYSAAKAGIIGLTHVLALEGVEHGIIANAVMPQATHPYSLDPATSVHIRSEEADRLAQNKAALGATGRTSADWSASLVIALASRECAVTGQTFSTVGGRYARAFLGLTRGWVPSACPEPEDLLDHLDEMREPVDVFLPESAVHEVEHVTALLTRL